VEADEAGGTPTQPRSGNATVDVAHHGRCRDGNSIRRGLQRQMFDATFEIGPASGHTRSRHEAALTAREAVEINGRDGAQRRLE